MGKVSQCGTGHLFAHTIIMTSRLKKSEALQFDEKTKPIF